MKKRLITAILLLSWQTAFAGESDSQVTQACSDQAREVVMEISSDVLPGMTAQQRGRIMQISSDACLKHMAGTQPLQTAGQPDETKEKKSKDWFTDYLLNGEAPNKPGNKRLKNLKR